MQQHATKKHGASAQSLGNSHLKLLREQFVGSDDQSVCRVCACSEWELRARALCGVTTVYVAYQCAFVGWLKNT